MVGARARQGPHQTAQKSTSTGLSLLTTSCSQLAAVNSTTLALAMSFRLSWYEVFFRSPVGTSFRFYLIIPPCRGPRQRGGQERPPGESSASLRQQILISHETLIAPLVVFSPEGASADAPDRVRWEFAGDETGRYPVHARNSRPSSTECVGPHSREAPVRILLVEDHKPLVRALRQGLEEEGFAVDIAADGEEGDYKARTAEYDVIILDLMLPKVDGQTLLQRWRKNGLKTHV